MLLPNCLEGMLERCNFVLKKKADIKIVEEQENNAFSILSCSSSSNFSPTLFRSCVCQSLKPEAFLLNWTREVSSNQLLTDWTCQSSKHLIGFGHSEVSAFAKWASPGFSMETECAIKSHFRHPLSPSSLIREAQSDKCLTQQRR